MKAEDGGRGGVKGDLAFCLDQPGRTGRTIEVTEMR